VLADLGSLAEASPYYVAARAGQVLRGMLRRGFTTVRDAGGADYGLAAAVDQGYFDGPRVVFGGKALSQTGGHADMRPRGRALLDQHVVSASLGTVCDGVAEVRRAAREELRRGAFHIKIMLSGGVASPTDRVDSTQFSVEEIRAAVEEATAANRYVMGHAYTSRAINRGLECGVRSIEHGNLMDESSIPVFLSHQAFYVPTLVTYSALAEDGRAAGLPEDSYRKVFDVLDAGLRALELADRAGVQIAFGTDLLGPMHAHQSREFTIRAQVQPPDAIIRSATTTAARLLNLEGQVGVVAPGAYADLLVVDGNPLEDIALLAAPDQHVKMIVKSGRFVAV
jgi:imidazolonepropionase-like amidohydrolase